MTPLAGRLFHDRTHERTPRRDRTASTMRPTVPGGLPSSDPSLPGSRSTESPDVWQIAVLGVEGLILFILTALLLRRQLHQSVRG